VGGNVVFTATDIFGTTSRVASFNGTNAELEVTDGWIDPGLDGPFTFFFWLKMADVTPAAGKGIFLLGGTSGVTKSFELTLNTSGVLRFVWYDDTDASHQVLYSEGQEFTDGQWIHIGQKYDASTDTGTAYINGRPIGSVAMDNQLDNSDTDQLQFGFNGGAEHTAMEIMDIGYDKTTWTDEQIYKLYTYKADHNKNVAVTDQRWALDINNGTLENESDQGWLVDKENNSVYWDFSDLSSTDVVSLKMLNDSTAPVQGVAGPGGSIIYSSDPGATIDFGLPAVPSNVTIKYETTTANEWQYMMVDSFCTLVVGGLAGCDFSALTISGARRLWVQANSGNAGAVALDLFDVTNNGILFNDVLQNDIVVPSGKSLIYPIMDLSGGASVTVEGTLFTNEIIGGTITGSGEIRGL
jgi:hypothetical protein